MKFRKNTFEYSIRGYGNNYLEVLLFRWWRISIYRCTFNSNDKFNDDINHTWITITYKNEN